MKKIFIHAGPGKTGTSAIQFALLNNRELLQSKGIFYPEHPADENNVSSGNFNRVLSKNQSKSFVVDTKKVERLKREFDSSLCDVMLLSSEHFFPLLKELNQAFENVTFILYLRNPIDVIESGYNQAVKRAFKTEKLQAKRHVEFRVLSLIEQLYENSNELDIILRPYSSQLFVRNNLISDFLSVFDIDFIVDEDQSINPSYCFEALELKRQLNHSFNDKSAVKIDKILQSYVTGTRDFSLLSPDVYEALRIKVTHQLEQFISRFSLTHLQPYLQELQNQTQKSFVQQKASVEDYESVLRFLEKKDGDLYKQIIDVIKDSEVVDSNLHLAINNNPAQAQRQPSVTVLVEQEDYSFISKIVEEIKAKPNINEVRFCRELGLALEKAGRIDEAVMFFKAVLYFKPDAEMIKNKLKKYT